MADEKKQMLGQIDGQVQPKRVGRNALIAGIVVVIVVAVLLVVWNSVRKPDISAYADTPITIEGLGDTFTVTPTDLLALNCEKGTYTGEGAGAGGESKAGAVEVCGPKLSTFLAKYGNGKTVKDFGRIVLRCADGYEVVLRAENIEEGIVLSVAEGMEAFTDKCIPLRVIVPSLSTGKWPRQVVYINFQQ